MSVTVSEARRRFLEFLAGSPFLATAGALSSTRQARGSEPESGSVIRSAEEALNLLDFEAAARKALPPAHYGYLATGVDDDATLRANREGFSLFQIRARRLLDVSRPDLKTTVLGEEWAHPIALAPAASHKAFHPEGETATARAAKSSKTRVILSTLATTPVEEVAAVCGGPVWFQLYPTNVWEITRKIVARAEKAGCPVLALTVDVPLLTNRETQQRFNRLDRRTCANCHPPGYGGLFERKPIFAGLDRSEVTSLAPPAFTWETVRRIRDLTRMKLVLKGIVTGEDAALAIKNGADGLIVSNHGGRAEESGRSTIESLPEVVAGVQGRIPVLLDGGVRRGTDVFKALALGAAAVAIGRPYLWGLAAFGEIGVEKAVEILKRELELTMQLCGAPTIRDIRPGSTVRK